MILISLETRISFSSNFFILVDFCQKSTGKKTNKQSEIFCPLVGAESGILSLSIRQRSSDSRLHVLPCSAVIWQPIRIDAKHPFIQQNLQPCSSLLKSSPITHCVSAETLPRCRTGCLQLISHAKSQNSLQSFRDITGFLKSIPWTMSNYNSCHRNSVS